MRKWVLGLFKKLVMRFLRKMREKAREDSDDRILFLGQLLFKEVRAAGYETFSNGNLHYIGINVWEQNEYQKTTDIDIKNSVNDWVVRGPLNEPKKLTARKKRARQRVSEGDPTELV